MKWRAGGAGGGAPCRGMPAGAGAGGAGGAGAGAGAEGAGGGGRRWGCALAAVVAGALLAAVVLAELKVHHDERAEGQYTGSHRSGT